MRGRNEHQQRDMSVARRTTPPPAVSITQHVGLYRNSRKDHLVT